MKLYDAGATLLVFFVFSAIVLGGLKLVIPESEDKPCTREHNSTITPCEE